MAKCESIIAAIILFLICVLAFSIRLFAVVRFESVIHEFDPQFNFRTTKYLTEHGFYDFNNWFDERTWYPLGRLVGTTVYPGLMVTAGFAHWVLNTLRIYIDIREVCVFTAPVFAGFTALTAFWMGRLQKDTSTGLVCAALIALVPGYISRSVAGSYDNEAVAIFAMLFCYTVWVKSVKTGSLLWSAVCSLAYFNMVAAWGGYLFVINLIPLYVVVMILIGKFSTRLYVAYSTLYVLGTTLSMQLRNILFIPVHTPEHMAAMGAFIFVQAAMAFVYVKSILDAKTFRSMLKFLAVAAVGAVVVAFFVSRLVPGFTGRVFSLLIPAGQHMAIVKSVSEHQPPVWTSFYMDLHILCAFMPCGAYFCFRQGSDANIFLILYGATSAYFASVMVRLVLVLAPIACVLSGIAISTALTLYMTRRATAKPAPAPAPAAPSPAVAAAAAPAAATAEAKSTDVDAKTAPVPVAPAPAPAPAPVAAAPAPAATSPACASKDVVPLKRPVPIDLVILFVAMISALLVYYVIHSTWVTSAAYSDPSIVLSASGGNGGRINFDDFREAYFWLRQNTPPESKILSWWDYGYQLSAMADRPVIVDNNTWNNSHIARVGKIMASNESTAIGLIRDLDVDYLLVVFGGMVGYASDDINKFLWMVRIAGSTDPSVKEADYLSAQGRYTVDRSVSETMRKSMMYKMCYHRFGSVQTDYRAPTGFDRVRNVEIGEKNVRLQYIEEAYTTEHWIVRIYKVKDKRNRVGAGRRA